MTRTTAWREDATLTATDRRVLETLEKLYGTRPVASVAPVARPLVTTKGPARSGNLALRTILLLAAAVSLVAATPQGRAMYDNVTQGASSLLADLSDR